MMGKSISGEEECRTPITLSWIRLANVPSKPLSSSSPSSAIKRTRTDMGFPVAFWVLCVCQFRHYRNSIESEIRTRTRPSAEGILSPSWLPFHHLDMSTDRKIWTLTNGFGSRYSTIELCPYIVPAARLKLAPLSRPAPKAGVAIITPSRQKPSGDGQYRADYLLFFRQALYHLSYITKNKKALRFYSKGFSYILRLQS